MSVEVRVSRSGNRKRREQRKERQRALREAPPPPRLSGKATPPPEGPREVFDYRMRGGWGLKFDFRGDRCVVSADGRTLHEAPTRKVSVDVGSPSAPSDAKANALASLLKGPDAE